MVTKPQLRHYARKLAMTLDELRQARAVIRRFRLADYASTNKALIQSIKTLLNQVRSDIQGS